MIYMSGTVRSAIAGMGLMRSSFVTCPLCKEALTKSKQGVLGHIRNHHKELKPHAVVLSMVLTNQKGCNRRLEYSSDETKRVVGIFTSIGL